MANPHEDQPDDILQRIIKQIESMHKFVMRIDLAYDDLHLQLKTLAGLLQADPRHSAVLGPAIRQTLAFSRTQNLLAKESARGASKVEPVRLPNGSTKFIIDRLRSVTLPPMPAALLSVLLADTGPSNDEFVAWKSRAKVRQRLRQMTGKQFSPGTLNQLVYRLRELLPEQAVHPDFIRRDTRRGLRFALRREPPGSAPPGSAPGI